MAYIRKIWTEEGPFDGMLGFSQGWGWIWMEDVGISAGLSKNIGGTIWSQGMNVYNVPAKFQSYTSKITGWVVLSLLNGIKLYLSPSPNSLTFEGLGNFRPQNPGHCCLEGAILIAALVALGEMKAGKPLVSRATTSSQG